MWTGDDDQPRERVLRDGPRRLDDVALVALVLRSGRSGQNAVELARALLARHGDVGGLAVTRPEVLADYAGMGPAKAAAVAAAFELGRRTSELAEAVAVRRAEDVVAVTRREMRGVRGDELLLFVTDRAHRVRWTVCVATGLVTRAAAPVRRILDAVLAHGGPGFAVARVVSAAAAVTTPLDEDLARRLAAAAVYAELRFHDYVVVADSTWCSVRTAVPLVLSPYDARAGP